MVINENPFLINGINGNEYSKNANCYKLCNKAVINGSKWYKGKWNTW